MFKLCGNMNLLQVHIRLQGKWESYSNKWQTSIVLMNNLTNANLQIVSNKKHVNKWHKWNYIYYIWIKGFETLLLQNHSTCAKIYLKTKKVIKGWQSPCCGKCKGKQALHQNVTYITPHIMLFVIIYVNDNYMTN